MEKKNLKFSANKFAEIWLKHMQVTRVYTKSKQSPLTQTQVAQPRFTTKRTRVWNTDTERAG